LLSHRIVLPSGMTAKSCLMLLVALSIVVLDHTSVSRQMRAQTKETKRVFVNYAFSGTRQDAVDNLDFFLRHGMTIPHPSLDLIVHYGIVINGKCEVEQCKHPENFVPDPKVSIRVLERENMGYDFGAHAAMLKELREPYDAYVFFNAGVTGPFTPSYMPREWHWTQAFTDKLRGSVGLVGTSIDCLKKGSWVGHGPRIEGFAFAMSREALETVRAHGTSFRDHATKREAVGFGEYNLSQVVLSHGFQIDTLLKAYQGVDWNDQSEWACNEYKHPSRKGSYFGISMHPLEVLFHKTHWAGQVPVLDNVADEYKEFKDGSKFIAATKENA